MVLRTLTAATLVLTAGLAWTQTLGEVARAEAERRKAVGKAARVYTNESLKPELPPEAPAPPPAEGLAVLQAPSAGAAGTVAGQGGTAAPAATPAAATPSAASSEPVTEADWRARAADLRGVVVRQKILADALQSRISALMLDFVNRDDPAQRAVIEQDRNSALAELERVKKDLKAAERAVTDFEESARRKAVPPGWLR